MTTSAGTTEFEYDYENRLTQITYPSTATKSFAYNGLHARVSSTVSAGTTDYMRNGASALAPLLKAGAVNFTPGVSARTSGSTAFYSSGMKSVDSQFSSSGPVTGTRSFDAFGNIAASSGSWAGLFGYGGSFGYQEDSDNLALLGHRMLDKSTGRFLTRDLAKHGRNWYVYAANRPTVAADPSGYISVFFEGDTDFFAGWGDALTWAPVNWITNGWSHTKTIRTILGVDDQVDYDSGGYENGQLVGAIHMSLFVLTAAIEYKIAAEGAKKIWPMVRGNRIHREIQRAYQQLDPNWQVEQHIRGHGRVDLVNHVTKQIIEIKPDNPNAIWKGILQLERYQRGLSLQGRGMYDIFILTY